MVDGPLGLRVFINGGIMAAVRETLAPEGASYNYGSSSSVAVGGVPDCLAGDFVGGGFAGAAAVCGGLDCFLVGGLPTVRYFRIFSSFFGPMPLMARRSSTVLKAP